MKIGFEKRIVSQRLSATDFLQNRQMGRASKKDWDTDIPCVRNVFAMLIVLLNPIRLKSKLS